MTQPKPPAASPAGIPGEWVKLGIVGVDSATIAVTDPAFTHSSPHGAKYRSAGCDRSRDFGSGVQFVAGFGDGRYEVWGWVVDYGDEEYGPDKRIAQIVVTLIDDQELRQWNNEQ